MLLVSKWLIDDAKCHADVIDFKRCICYWGFKNMCTQTGIFVLFVLMPY